MLAGFYMFAKTMNRNLTLLAAFLIVDFMASKPSASTCAVKHTDVIVLTAMHRSYIGIILLTLRLADASGIII